MFLYRLWSVEWVRVSSAGIAVGLRKFADAFEYRLLIQGSEARHKRTHAVKYNTTWARQRVPTYVKRFTLILITRLPQRALPRHDVITMTSRNPHVNG